MQKNILISMKNIVKSFKLGGEDIVVLNNISLEIMEGEFVAILGPSGSGKSTLMNIIGCIDIASSGEYSFSGQDIKARSEDDLADVRNKEIGFIFQKFNLLAKHTALQNVALPLIIRGEKRKTADAKAKLMLTRVGLEDRMGHKPTELSGGQQQRVSIARALVGEPKLLLADEPTGNLDSKSGKEILNMFLDLHKEGNTIIIITHDLNVAKMAQRIIRIADGMAYEDEDEDEDEVEENTAP